MIKDLGKRLGDLNSLPESLKSKLKVVDVDEQGKKIIAAINNSLDGYGSIDEIMIAYYKLYSVELERPYLANKLYRLSNDGHLFSIKKKKGAFTTKKELVEAFIDKKQGE